MRDAENRHEIIARTFEETGIHIELLSGEDEALWTYRGAIAGMDVNGDVGVIDIGGGSTEIAYGSETSFKSGNSFDIGAVRITERFIKSNPISMAARDDAANYVRQVLSSAEAKSLSELIAVAGTPTTLASMDQYLPIFDVAKVHGYLLYRSAILDLLDVMFSLDTNTLLARYPCVNKARADILPAGTLILAAAMDLLGVEHVRVSTQGLRYGIALRELG
jgi:exopolyphosphatase/guanosine-5'-triphosphate,3'-diphosphate pyrophosphatase